MSISKFTLKNEEISQEYTQKNQQFSIKNFINGLEYEINEYNDEELIFTIKGIDVAIANTLRRIIIAEVPTMAIENVIIYQNTSIIPDEVLAHRLGLIPILANPSDFNFKTENDHSAETSIKFKLNIKCYKDKESEKIFYSEVYSNHLEWIPLDPKQKKLTPSPRPVDKDILIAKLAPGQEIEIEMYCIKGIGKEHAKWSPVSTAYYRLNPSITIKSEISENDAKELVDLCPKKVFAIEKDHQSTKKYALKVLNPKACTSCRECIRNPKFENIVSLEKKSDEFEFHLESTGIMKPEIIFIEAIKILRFKCEKWMNSTEEIK